jgi:hypothetical protein
MRKNIDCSSLADVAKFSPELHWLKIIIQIRGIL